MALFGTKNKETKVTKTKAVKPASKSVVTAPAKTVAKVVTKSPTIKSPALEGSVARTIYSSAILRPRITEKSGILSSMGVYTFEISAGANKNMIFRAVQDVYKVTPVKVAIVNLPSRAVFIKGRKGTVTGVRKALVTLKKGDKIDFV